MHSAEENERRILEMTNIASETKKTKQSSNFQGVECATYKYSLAPRELQSVKQKSTIYPMTKKIKLSSKPITNQELFNTGEDDDESVEEYDFDMSFPNPSNTRQKSDKKNQSATETLEEYSKRKAVSLSETFKNSKQSLKQQVTPYHPTNKKFKGNTCGDVKQVLFQVEDIESVSDSNSSESFSDCKLTYTPSLSKSKDKVSGENMNVTELICDKEKCESTVTDSTDILWVSDFSDSEYSQNSEECVIIEHYREVVEISDTSEEDGPADVALDTSKKSRNINAGTKLVDQHFFFKNALLIVLQNNSKLYFHGFTTVKVLYGKIEILGYTLTSSNESVDVFSPRGSSYLYFATNNRNNSTAVRNGLPDKLYNLGMDSESVTKIYQCVKTDSTVILCNEINKVEIAFMRKHISQELYPKCKNGNPQCVFQSGIGSWDVLKPNRKWDVEVTSINVFSKTLICGGEGVGKSTMLRYMINRLLMEHQRILLIDLDSGQPEFTLPGCISATIIAEPVFGPSYTHLRKPDRCLFVSNLNVLHQVDRYLSSVKQLILSCSDFQKMPTLINYIGFTEGYGLQIFSAVVAYTQPTRIIQINSSAHGRNFEKQLTYELILDTSRTLVPETESIPHFDIITVSSMTKEGWGSQRQQIREMCVLSYFGKILPKGVSSLTGKEVPLFVVDLSDVTLLCNAKIVPPAVVNGNLVALCCLETGYCVCLGWGVVRGIDLSTQKLYLITPVCPKELEQVDHLILGSVALPPSVYMTSDENSGLIPHISEGVLTSLGQRSYLPPNSN